MRFAPGGVLPGPEASERVRVDEGQAVLFEPGEWMTAVVLEGESLEPAEPSQRGSDPATKE